MNPEHWNHDQWQVALQALQFVALVLGGACVSAITALMKRGAKPRLKFL